MKKRRWWPIFILKGLLYAGVSVVTLLFLREFST